VSDLSPLSDCRVIIVIVQLGKQERVEPGVVLVSFNREIPDSNRFRDPDRAP
jgi:hypothetical protein